MNDFKIKLGRVRNEADDFEKMAQALANYQEELASIRGGLRFQIAGKERIEKRLNQQSDNLSAEQQKMSALASGLVQIADLYEKTESALADVEFGDSKSNRDKFEWSFFKDDSLKITKDGKYGAFGENIINSLDPDSKIKENADKFNSWVTDHRKKTSWYKGNFDFDESERGMQKVDLNDADAVKKFDDEMKKTKAMSTSMKFVAWGGTLYEKSWIEEEAIAGEKEGTHASAKMAISQRKVDAEAYGGLYRTDPDTGMMEFRPGVGANIGASYTLFTAAEEAQLGNKWLGAYIKAEETVGKVGASAEANVGLWDKDGKFNPSVYGGLEAEAIAGEVSGKVGAKVLGTDVGLEGSLGYGVGAHANVGFKDGTLSLDVGAYVGVGASVGLEIDVSGTIEAICDRVSSVWDLVTD